MPQFSLFIDFSRLVSMRIYIHFSSAPSILCDVTKACFSSKPFQAEGWWQYTSCLEDFHCVLLLIQHAQIRNVHRHNFKDSHKRKTYIPYSAIFFCWHFTLKFLFPLTRKQLFTLFRKYIFSFKHRQENQSKSSEAFHLDVLINDFN